MKDLKKLIIGGAIGIVIIGCLIVAFMLKSSDGDFAEYVKLKMEDGPNGYAKIEKVAFTAKFETLLREKTKSGDALSLIAYEEELEKSINYNYDDKKLYSNGDVVDVKVDFDEEILKEHDLDFSDTTIQLTVRGLKEPKEVVNPLKHGKIVYEGASPFLTAKYVENEDDEFGLEVYDEYESEIKNNGQLKNGDSFTIKFVNWFEDSDDYYGVEPNKKEITISGQSEYVKNISEMQKYNDKEMVKKVKDTIEDDMSNTFATVKDIQVIGKSVAYNKKYIKDSNSDKQQYVIYYCSEVRKPDKFSLADGGKGFFMVTVPDVVTKNGKISSIGDYETVGLNHEWEYKSLNDLKKAVKDGDFLSDLNGSDYEITDDESIR